MEVVINHGNITCSAKSGIFPKWVVVSQALIFCHTFPATYSDLRGHTPAHWAESKTSPPVWCLPFKYRFPKCPKNNRGGKLVCRNLGISARTFWEKTCSLVVTDTSSFCQFEPLCNTGSESLVAQPRHVSFCQFASCQCWLSLLKRCPPELSCLKKLRMRSALFAKNTSLRFLLPERWQNRERQKFVPVYWIRVSGIWSNGRCECLWIQVKLMFAVKCFWARWYTLFWDTTIEVLSISTEYLFRLVPWYLASWINFRLNTVTEYLFRLPFQTGTSLASWINFAIHC